MMPRSSRPCGSASPGSRWWWSRAERCRWPPCSPARSGRTGGGRRSSCRAATSPPPTLRPCSTRCRGRRRARSRTAPGGSSPATPPERRRGAVKGARGGGWGPGGKRATQRARRPMTEPAASQPGGEAALTAAAERLAHLVQLESPSGDVARLGVLRDVLADRLARLGGTVELLPGDAGDHVRAQFPAAFPDAGRAAAGRAQAGGHILVVGHYDTVWEAGWLASHPFEMRGLVATGPGVLDMKGAIVALELAFELLADSGRALAQPVQVVLVGDEEVSSPHGRTSVMDAAAGAAAVVGLEPPHPDGGLKTGPLGVARVRLDLHGPEAPARPTAAGGVSAIDQLLHQLLPLRDAPPPAAGPRW